MPNNISTWLQFALQQMATESYLNGIDLTNEQQVTLRLTDGNNNRQVVPEAQFQGKTRFTDLQAAVFFQRYQIIDQHADDSSGFSATLLYDTQT